MPICPVWNGGDRDTLGAMADGYSGAYLGIDGIPEAWRQEIENRFCFGDPPSPRANRVFEFSQLIHPSFPLFRIILSVDPVKKIYGINQENVKFCNPTCKIGRYFLKFNTT